MNALQSPILWLIVVGIALVVTIARIKKRNSSDWGFKEVVKNPGYWEGFSQAQQELDEKRGIAIVVVIDSQRRQKWSRFLLQGRVEIRWRVRRPQAFPPDRMRHR